MNGKAPISIQQELLVETMTESELVVSTPTMSTEHLACQQMSHFGNLPSTNTTYMQNATVESWDFLIWSLDKIGIWLWIQVSQDSSWVNPLSFRRSWLIHNKLNKNKTEVNSKKPIWQTKQRIYCFFMFYSCSKQRMLPFLLLDSVFYYACCVFTHTFYNPTFHI